MKSGEQLDPNQFKSETIKYAGKKELDLGRVAYWKEKAEERLKLHSKDLLEFAGKYEDLINEGNYILLERQGTGFNI